MSLLFATNKGDLLATIYSTKRNETLQRDKAEISAALAALEHDATLKVESSKALAISIASHRSISTGNLAFGRDCDLGGETKAVSGIFVNSLMQTNVVRAIAHFVGNVAYVIQDIAINLHRLSETGGLFGGRNQFETNSSC